MAAATAGRVRNVHTLAEAYCNLIEACAGAGEWERAKEWCELVDEFARTHATAPLFGACRTVHADVLMAAGRWPEAEHALETALATHERYVPQMGAPTIARMAELRVRQGRLAEAAQLLAGARGAALVAAGARPAPPRRGPAAGGGGAAGARAARAPRATPSAPPSCWRRSSTPASPAATWPAPARPPTSSPTLAGRVRHPAHRRPRRPRRRAGGDRRGRRGRRGRVAPSARWPPSARSRCRSTPREARLELARAIAGRHAGGRRRRGSRRARRVPRARRGPGDRRRRRAAARPRRRDRRPRPRRPAS